MAYHILTINDTQTILDLFQMILEDEGYQVTRATFITQNIKDVEKINPDLIILDLIFGGEASGIRMAGRKVVAKRYLLRDYLKCKALW